MNSFYNRPDRFSFKDVLAIAFSGAFLWFCWKALKSEDALQLVKTLVPLIGIILGGYFGQEMASTWVSSRRPTTPTGRKEDDYRGTI